MVLILAVTASQKRDMQEIGLGLAFLGALAVVLSGALGLRSASRTAERSTMIVAGIFLAVGFAVQLFALHSVVAK
jgi:drug/metabolite transporter (DMT)-like permease